MWLPAVWLPRPRGCGQRTHQRMGRACYQVGKGASSFPWDYISLGLGWIRYLSKMTNQCPRLSQALNRVYLLTNPFFPQARLTSLFGQAPTPCAILTSRAQVPTFPCSHLAIWPWSRAARAQCCGPLQRDAVASWGGTQASASRCIRLNV